ncbi:hypothetical protein CONLIGDRAFT_575701 [Coniochaeta ligniaria NRRL 30616]|uniref:Glycoside hydrolase subgroup catalytic core n=1 Tax=Coniochaeta ligniaria NRRL 30616 TaxID=1408157 RepID=A0A1J7J827_9PEZI|nr:hypothetical protein CONLIGDRAFT_575701 [Coniochaeta ligniaria NRRL 30616]
MLGVLGLCLLAVTRVLGQETGNHPEWDRWCGKVYEAGFPSFDPGGQTLPPTPVPGPPLLDVQFKPRYSLYLDSEKQGEFIVNAPLSQFFGKAWPDTKPGSSNKLVFSINLVSDDEPLVKNQVPINTTGNIFTFDLTRLSPSPDPIQVILTGGPAGDNADPTWTANSTILYLPSKPTGSATRIDNLNGGLFLANAASHRTFQPLFPYGFYASFDGFLANVTPTNTSAIDHYAGLGLNAMTPLTIYADGAPALDYMDAIDLKFMYDLREGYKNLTYVSEQALAARNAEAIFAYWSADEPDGWQDPFSAPTDAQAVLHALDPYHPVAVVLNCQDYYFGPYTAGADIIMEDVYPIGINSTFSKWGTACNATLGDCGCDNCKGGVWDVPDRLDDLSKYERWLNLWPKTKFHNPQSFHGEGYWARDPTPEEEWVMVLLAVNHGAKGIISWVWPASDILGVAHGELAKVLTVSPVVDFIVGGDTPHAIAVDVPEVDAAYWVVGKKMLISVVNGGNVAVNQTVTVSLPKKAKGIASVPWGGSTGWTLAGGKLSVPSLPALSTALLVLDISSCSEKRSA